MSRKSLASLGACVVTLALAAGVLAETPPMQDAKKKTTPAYAQTTSSPRASL
jgi:hypothetical protein